MAIITFPLVVWNETHNTHGKYITEASVLEWRAGHFPNHIVFFHDGKYIIMEKLSPIDGRPDLGYTYRGVNSLGTTLYIDVVND